MSEPINSVGELMQRGHMALAHVNQLMQQEHMTRFIKDDEIRQIMGVSDPLLINDLRLHVLNGQEIEPEEMLSIVDQIRAGRRSAANRVKAAKEAKPAKRAVPRKLAGEELDSLLDI